MRSLKVLGVNLMSYYDDTQQHDLADLSTEYSLLERAVDERGLDVGVTLDRAAWEPKARESIKNNQLDIALSRVQSPEELPDEAADINLAVRGDAA